MTLRSWKRKVDWSGVFIVAAAVGIFAGMMRTPPRKLRPGLIVTQLPRCADGEVLVYTGGGLTCGSTNVASLPDCTNKFLTTKKEGDIVSLTCR